MAERNSVYENVGEDGNEVLLPKEVSSEIWADTIEESAVMRFSNRINLPASGLAVPMITGDPEADWAGETDEITVGDSTLDNREMKGHKMGVIETFSNEFRRDMPTIYSALRERLPRTLATKFDSTVAFGTTGDSSPVDQSTFDSFQKTGVLELPLSSDSTYDDLVDIDATVAEAGGELSAYALSPRARRILLNAKDLNERPLLVSDLQRDGRVSSLLGVDFAQTSAFYKAGTAEPAVAETLGIAGDWRSAYVGVVEAISISVSDQATLTKNGSPVNLWQRDMFAVKVTVHLGFMIRKGHEDRFVRVTGATPAE